MQNKKRSTTVTDTLRLSGMFVHNDSGDERRPGIVLFPDACGIGDHAIERARRLAASGIAVLVADLKGNGYGARLGIDGRLAVLRDTLARESTGCARRPVCPSNC